jgi:hypothetical protein
MTTGDEPQLGGQQKQTGMEPGLGGKHKGDYLLLADRFRIAIPDLDYEECINRAIYYYRWLDNLHDCVVPFSELQTDITINSFRIWIPSRPDIPTMIWDFDAVKADG